MQHNNLASYLRNIFMMKVLFNYSTQEIESMMPWERDVYIDLINDKQRKDSENNGY